jgi:hypothetical protein
MLVPKPTGTKPASLVGALLLSTDPNHSGATATIGGIIIDIPYTGQLENIKSYHGVSICTEQEEFHKWEKERKCLAPSETVLERGKQLGCLRRIWAPENSPFVRSPELG